MDRTFLARQLALIGRVAAVKSIAMHTETHRDVEPIEEDPDVDAIGEIARKSIEAIQGIRRTRAASPAAKQQPIIMQPHFTLTIPEREVHVEVAAPPPADVNVQLPAPVVNFNPTIEPAAAAPIEFNPTIQMPDQEPPIVEFKPTIALAPETEEIMDVIRDADGNMKRVRSRKRMIRSKGE